MKTELFEAKLAAYKGVDIWDEYRRGTAFRKRFNALCKRFDQLYAIAANHPGISRQAFDGMKLIYGIQPILSPQLERLRQLDTSFFPLENEDDESIPAFSVQVAKSDADDALEAATYLTYAFSTNASTLDPGIGTGETYAKFWERIRLPGAAALAFTTEGEPPYSKLVPAQPEEIVTYSDTNAQFEGMHAALSIVEQTPRSF